MTPPDVLLIVLDSQRADRLGCYGYPDAITPNLDSFAREAALFEQAISPAQWTIPTHASLFTGLYPTAHQVTQYRQTLGANVPHLAEMLSASGYRTIGLSNNALVGVLKNGFTRGFDTFYNYSGALPNVLEVSTHSTRPLGRIVQRIGCRLRCVAGPIQDRLGQSDLAYRIALRTRTIPRLAKLANAKGQNERSVDDLCRLLEVRNKTRRRKPLFLFLNLMETHMPFRPPDEFLDKVAPGLRSCKKTRDVIRAWTGDAYRWEALLDPPLEDLERRVLDNLYNAEVAYQDDYLGRLFDVLAKRDDRANVLTIVTADHGQALGDHDCFGHSFGAHQELIHVPLLLHWPDQIESTRASKPVSTRRIFHTLLDVGGCPSAVKSGLDPVEIRRLALQKTLNIRDPEDNATVAEVYPALHSVRVMETRRPRITSQRRARSLHRVIVKDNFKLIKIDDVPEELYNLESDPLELSNIIAEAPMIAETLDHQLSRMIDWVKSQGRRLSPGAELDVGGDEQLKKRLRGLGYIE